MKIDKFEASDTAKALRLVRLTHGDDAVILSNKRTAQGIEIIAASDFDESLYQSIRDELSRDGEPSQRADSEPTVRPPEDFGGIKAGLDDLRSLITAEFARKTHLPITHRDSDSAARFAKLVQIGFGESEAFKVSEAMGEGAADQLNAASLTSGLEKLLIKREPGVFEQGGVAAFVGPTGVGKTTSIAKLAAQLRLRYGADSVTLISADSRRIGAHQQLARIAELLGIPLYEAHDNAALASVVDMAAGARWTLIDTAGLSLSDPALDSTLCTLRQLPQPVKLVLTLAANTQPSYLEWVIQHYQHYRPDAIALTKTDECTQLAPALGSLIATEQSLLLVADGQRIPDDLHPADDRLAKLAATLLSPVQARAARVDTPEAAAIKENSHVTA